MAFDNIAGGETAGIPFAALVAERMALPMTYVRKKPKGYGKNSQVEGVLHAGQRVLLAEDMTTDGGGWTAVHHPFTSPNSEWVDRFEEAPDKALAWAYDIVCNGNEIGGGSIRIHRSDVQERVFSLLGLSDEEAREKFGFLLDAFAYGPPPHGGIAFGWDRICMLLSGATSLRDVIAFPKTGAGFDPLTSAPTPITDQQRLEAGIDADPFAQDASDD